MLIKRYKRIIKSRTRFAKSAKKQLVLRYIISNMRYVNNAFQKFQKGSEITDKSQSFYRYLLDSLNLYKASFSTYALKARSRNHCLITTRSRSVYQFCRLTRMQIKRFIGKDLLPGVRRSSW